MKGLDLQVPSVLSWKVMDEHDNLYNTQCIFAIWAMQMVTDRLIAQGGLEENVRKVEARAQRVMC
jgi:phosphoserine aminotransferase